MIAYLDSSVILRALFNEEGAYCYFKKIRHAISSELLRLESLRVIDRVRHVNKLTEREVALLHAELHSACRKIEVVKITALVLGMAGQPFPTSVRTLDALHLTSAMLWQQSNEKELLFLTHDKQQATAAQSLGFMVEGVD